MPDIERVKTGLECCTVKSNDRRCPECPYRDPTTDCTSAMHRDAMDVIDTLSAALEAMTGDDCEACEIEPDQESEAE